MSKILVVDDEFRIRQIIRKYAEFEGYEVEEATDGMQAIQICRQKEFDLIIMDVMMPELDGFSACREIRKFRDTPIIMLSARGEEYDKIHGFELGSDDYVVKPFSPKELMMRVGAVIKRSGKGAEEQKNDAFAYNGLGGQFLGAHRHHRRQARGDDAQGIRPFLLYGAQQGACPHARQPDSRGVGLRLFRRRAHARYTHQAAAQKLGRIQQVHCNAQRSGIQI